MSLGLLSQVITVVGPTASAKTPLSLILAERLQSEIISADSRQIYRKLDIGTAKPPRADLVRIVHHFIDIREPDEMYSAGEYGRSARATVHRLATKNQVPVVVGGSGLYIRALTEGLFEGPGQNDEMRRHLEFRWEEEGGTALFEELRRHDPDAAAGMDVSKKRRIIRALEVYHMTGRPLSELHRTQRREQEFEFVQFALDWPREQLYERIDRRVDSMIASGLEDEVQSLLNAGYNPQLNALNTVGYKEIVSFLEGKISTLAEAVALIKRNSRRFAKRQLTWFRADARIRWIPMKREATMEEVAERILAAIRSEK
ncbi:MAG: tRNA (adenosine(37)-N6)-dimethylallyltransferase MiaA [Ignavibacteria bacterium]|nr:tRNA (adenosine(37)-N6)-dimethylallyltransferase MiaA [Ignavibacteria bacterium]